MAFDLERFMDLSKAVNTSDIDWEYVARVGLTDDEARCLRYMADVESHTVIYMRDILAGHSARDPEVVGFVACWAYEEINHGRALAKFLRVAGRDLDAGRYERSTRGASWHEDLEMLLSHTAARLTPHFAAAHMAWGAASEMTAALAYQALAEFTDNHELRKLLLRLARDERRHQSFYYHQAKVRLGRSAVARFLGDLAMRRFWGPVGEGVGEESGFSFIAALLFDDEPRREELRAGDRLIAKLPGLEWFDRAEVLVADRAARYRRENPAEARRIDQLKREKAERRAA